MKTVEELKTLKEEVETLNRKLAELSEEELEQVAGGEDSETFSSDLPQKFICPECFCYFWTRKPGKIECPYCGFTWGA